MSPQKFTIVVMVNHVPWKKLKVYLDVVLLKRVGN